MPWARTVVGKRSASVGDSYRSLADLLLGITAKESGYRVPNGLVTVATNGATFAYGQQPTDLAAGVGHPVAAGDGFGMNSDLEAAWDLAEVWVRNTTALSVAVVTVGGPVFVERP